jgi:integrase
MVVQERRVADMKKICMFSEISQEWLLSLKPQIKESTFNKYHNLLKKYINPELGKMPPGEITCGGLERMCARLLQEGGTGKRGLSGKTVADSLSVVRRVLSYASTHYEVKTCDANSVRVKQKGREIRIFSDSEQEKLCAYLYSHPDKFNTGILVCLFTGLRIGEICGLHWEDISFEDRTIRIRRTIQRIQLQNDTGSKTHVIITSPKSVNSLRTIPIPDILFPIICEHKKTNCGFFLTNSSDEFVEPRLMQIHFKKVIEECGLEPANFHALRHSFATRCVELGMDVKCLSEILGHAGISITMERYVHPSMEMKRENINRLSALLDAETRFVN